MLLWIFVIFLLLAGGILLIGWSFSTPGHQGPATPHFDGKQFRNKSGAKARGFAAVLQWIIKRDQGPWAKNYETTQGEAPVSSSDQMRITFVNHSTFLIQWNDLNILTDPIWSERCSPVSFAGPQRMRPPGIRFEDLPPIDAVLISHNHYDHLDIPSIKRIQKEFAPVFVVPLGVKKHLAQLNIENTIELDWWQSAHIGMEIKAVPAQHFSGRGMFDRDQTLWAGYVISDGIKKIYFAGDSGYAPLFKEIGKKEGPMDVSLIPIGAYMPQWFMSPVHISPEEAIKVHQDVRSRQSIAMHFGTFPLADEGQGKAEEDLILSLAAHQIPQSEFIIPEEGEVWTAD
ncbi:MBL fold metallo-hydrolase [Marinoscillum furvescens]|uniref:L-ascorbate metabolism protein UlaG (Beta-lactamase superfamily) n=1 Tax=Marinoscillum furvescens DSM 4134 TaxID=1122208 RepID=A0A3D9L8S8_MARFU|nr:MBL fold metallo-hydrolase [Marinoscillum furvescens]REE02076.1 L-ascorbate metabolism protein UlaG (beta-lactamase superfamily) [Marinoscillum furvescens DSM 4134]